MVLRTPSRAADFALPLLFSAGRLLRCPTSVDHQSDDIHWRTADVVSEHAQSERRAKISQVLSLD